MSTLVAPPADYIIGFSSGVCASSAADYFSRLRSTRRLFMHLEALRAIGSRFVAGLVDDRKVLRRARDGLRPLTSNRTMSIAWTPAVSSIDVKRANCCCSGRRIAQRADALGNGIARSTARCTAP
jgi:hypothetical protein